MKVLIISVHPDDEALGCGGTLLKHVEQGDQVAWLIVTHMSETSGYSDTQVITREKEIKKVSSLFGFSKTINLGFPPMTLDSSVLGQLVVKISKVVVEFSPEVIYLPNRSDAHSDHRVAFDAVMACTKSFRYPYIKKILMYECVSETEFAPALPEKVFIPNYFVDITDWMEKKIEILDIYKSEMAEHPFPRSIRNIKALATFRGASVGVEYAEAFSLLKYIDK